MHERLARLERCSVAAGHHSSNSVVVLHDGNFSWVASMNLDAWDRLLSDLRKLSAEIDQKKKDVKEYELFECHKRVFTADFQEKG